MSEMSESFKGSADWCNWMYCVNSALNRDNTYSVSRSGRAGRARGSVQAEDSSRNNTH